MSEITQNDEIDLKDLLRAIIRTRVVLVVALLVVTSLFWTAQIGLSTVAPPTNTHAVNIYLTFEGATEGVYPNNTEYRPYDIIAPVILNRVYDDSPLANYVERDDFISGFTVVPYAPDQELIRSKYNLDTNGLSQVEIENLQEQLRNELNQSASTAATISFTTTNSKIPGNVLQDVLRNIPETWAQHMVSNLGVLNYERTIYSSAVVDTELIDQMDYLIAFEIFREKIRLLRENITAIERLPNGRIVRDDDSGLSAPDLERAVFELEHYQIKPLVTPIRNLGIAKNNEVLNLYFEDQLRELARSRQLAEKKKQNLTDAYNTYVNNQIETAGTRPAIATQGTVMPQFGTEFLDRIMDLTDEGKDLQFRQNLTNQQVTLSNELSDIETEITRVSEIMATLKTSSREKYGMLSTFDEAQLSEGLQEIANKLIIYFDVSTRIYETVSVESLGVESTMFRFVDAEVFTRTEGAILNTNNLKLFAIALFLTLVTVVPLTMIRQALKEEASPTGQALLPDAED